MTVDGATGNVLGVFPVHLCIAQYLVLYYDKSSSDEDSRSLLYIDLSLHYKF